MNKIKNTLLVSALSIGLIAGAVGIVSAATSTDIQQKAAATIEPDAMAVEMNTGSHSTVTHNGSNGKSASMDMNAGQNISSNIQVFPLQQPDQQPYPENALREQLNPRIPVNVITDGNFNTTLGGSGMSGQWFLNMGL